jgi:hypothetical protein
MECISSEQLIVSINNKQDILLVAEGENRVDNIVCGKIHSKVLNIFDSVLRELDFLQIVYGVVHVGVGGEIVVEDNVVVLVVLVHQ